MRGPLSVNCTNVFHNKCVDTKCNCSCHNKSTYKELYEFVDTMFNDLEMLIERK